MPMLALNLTNENTKRFFSSVLRVVNLFIGITYNISFWFIVYSSFTIKKVPQKWAMRTAPEKPKQHCSPATRSSKTVVTCKKKIIIDHNQAVSFHVKENPKYYAINQRYVDNKCNGDGCTVMFHDKKHCKILGDGQVYCRAGQKNSMWTCLYR